MKTENLQQTISTLNGCKGSDFCIENEPRMQEKCSFFENLHHEQRNYSEKLAIVSQKIINFAGYCGEKMSEKQ